MGPEGDVYEYIALYFNNLEISARDHESLMDALEKNIRSSLGERDQFNFTLHVIYYVIVMLFYDLTTHIY